MPSLNKQGLIDGAKQAAQDEISFDTYCDMVSKMVISGQSKEEVAGMLMAHGIHLYFEGFAAGREFERSITGAKT